MSECVIETTNLRKQFRIYSEPGHTLKQASLRLLRGKSRYQDFVALDGVDFRVQRGDAIGLVGANGSGKSTLFKLISGILKPTAGSVRVAGTVSPVIELSAGFHPELTGIENIYLNGAVYGQTQAEVDTRLDDILAFASIGQHIHNPLRTYSSGMMARLAFAVAIHVDADIFLFDEVLAVGDTGFHQRCLDRIDALCNGGATVVYVSHNLQSVADLCTRVHVLQKGRIVRSGPPSEVLPIFEDHMLRGAPLLPTSDDPA